MKCSQGEGFGPIVDKAQALPSENRSPNLSGALRLHRIPRPPSSKQKAPLNSTCCSSGNVALLCSGKRGSECGEENPPAIHCQRTQIIFAELESLDISRASYTWNKNLRWKAKLCRTRSREVEEFIRPRCDTTLCRSELAQRNETGFSVLLAFADQKVPLVGIE